MTLHFRPSAVLLAVFTLMATTSSAQSTLQEGFENWPPPGWTLEALGAGNGFIQDWQGLSYAGDHSAYAAINNSACDHWLVSPAVEVLSANYQATFWELNQSVEFYDNRSVWVSAGNSSPGNADFELLATFEDIPEDWTERVLDLSAFAGQTIHLAFRYQGTWHAWFVDEVTIAPSSFTDASLEAWTAPGLFSSTLSPQTFTLNAKNWGTETIETATVQWSIHGEAQPDWTGESLDWAPGETLNISLGEWTPATSGYHDLEASITVTGDFDDSNNSVSSTFDVSSPKQLDFIRARPEGLQPIVDNQHVYIDVRNAGTNTIDTIEVSWSINGGEPEVWMTESAGLSSGETDRLYVGEVSLSQGLYTFDFEVHALGDPNWPADVISTSVQVDMFHEGFEAGWLDGLPAGWTTTFGLVEGTNFDDPHEGDFYYTAMPDVNVFGQITDTLWTPPLTVSSGDTFSFFVKKNDFLATTNQVYARHTATGATTLVGNLIGLPANVYQEVILDISAYQGVFEFGVTSEVVDFPGLCRFDLFTSTAKPFWPEVDLAMGWNEPHYTITNGEQWTHDCVLHNRGLANLDSADYFVHLLALDDATAAWDTLASVAGPSCASWEEIVVPISYTWSDTAAFDLRFAVTCATDEDVDNNDSRITTVQTVPADAILSGGNDGTVIQPGMNMPFNAMSNAMSLGQDDISQTLFRAPDLTTGGTLYGIALHYDDPLMDVLYEQPLPLQISVLPTADVALSPDGYDPTAFTPVYDGTVMIEGGWDQWVYLPFQAPISYSGNESLVVQFYQYDPTWPPPILRFYHHFSNEPDVIRTQFALDVYDLDPLETLDYGFLSPDFPDVRFVMIPESNVAAIGGTITDATTGEGVPTATVSVSGSSLSAAADADGSYLLLDMPVGTYALTIAAPGYATEVWSGELPFAGLNLDFALEPLPLVGLTGVVVADDAPEIGLSDVLVSLGEGLPFGDVVTDADGHFAFESVWGETAYLISAARYGHLSGEWGPVEVGGLAYDLDTLILERARWSPYDPVVSTDGILRWKAPHTGEETRRALDTDTLMTSYTNEPDEEVWLGNRFELGADTTTVMAIEVRFDIYDLDAGQLTVEVLDEEGGLLTTSEVFVSAADTAMTIPVAQLPLSGTVFAMLHWQGNAFSTHALALDFSDNVAVDCAAIAYPDEAPQLLSDFFGSGDDVTQAFHVRLITWDDAGTDADDALGFEVVRGPAEDFPDLGDWSVIANAEAGDTSIVDADWEELDPTQSLRYAVRTVYASGVSRWTFTTPSNPTPSGIEGHPSLSTDPQVLPNIARVGTPISLVHWDVDEVFVLDAKGRLIHTESWTEGQHEQGILPTFGWSPGTFYLLGLRNEEVITHDRLTLLR